MIKQDRVILEELYNIQDKLNSLVNEFNKEVAHERYVDEKLRGIEGSVRYLRSVVNEAIEKGRAKNA